MGTYAHIEDGVVVNVIVAEPEWIKESPIAHKYVETFPELKQCTYAGIGMAYDESKDVFIPKKPFASWDLNEENKWEAPTAQPDTKLGELVYWDEKTMQWLKK